MTRRPVNPGASTPSETPAPESAQGQSGLRRSTSTTLRLRISELAGRKSTGFLIEPDATSRASLAGELGLLSLPRLRFEGKLEPKGRRDWSLSGKLGATVVQPCVVTLEPVRTRIDETVERLYAADFIEPEGEEVEMPEDDRLEPLPDVIDLGEVMSEALSLALPLYPRASDAAPTGDVLVAPPGAEPLTDDEVKPFAGLKALREQLTGGAGSDESPAKPGKKLH